MREHILVAHSDQDDIAALRRFLDRNGLRASSVTSHGALFDAVRRGDPDLVVLDVGQRGFDGVDIVREVQRIRDVPLILQSAVDEVMERIIGLELGADDYVLKPYNPRELLARIRAVLRRHARAPEEAQPYPTLPAYVTFGNVHFDTMRETARCLNDGRDLELTHKEAMVLTVIVAAKGGVVRRLDLMRQLYGANAAVTERVIDAHVARLRKKLAPAAGGVQLVETVHGEGYRFSHALPLDMEEARAS